MTNIKNSQNFLHNSILIDKLISSSNIHKDDIVYDIGAGKGIITYALSKVANKVVAFEIDDKYAKYLIEKFGDVPNVNVVHKDFLQCELIEKKYKVFSNIPFNITADIINKLITSENRPQDMYFVIQYEAMQKCAGMPYAKDCLKSLLYKPLYQIKVVYNFKPTDFKPMPSVNIVLVHFHLREWSDVKNATIEEYWDFLAYLFSNSGVSLKEKTKEIFSYEQLKRIAKVAKIDKDHSFISEWTYEQLLILFNYYNQLVNEDKKILVNGSYRNLKYQQSKLEKIHRNRNNLDDKTKSRKFIKKI